MCDGLQLFASFAFSGLYLVCLSSCTVLFVTISQVIGLKTASEITEIVSGRGVKLYPNSCIVRYVYVFNWLMTAVCVYSHAVCVCVSKFRNCCGNQLETKMLVMNNLSQED